MIYMDIATIFMFITEAKWKESKNIVNVLREKAVWNNVIDNRLAWQLNI